MRAMAQRTMGGWLGRTTAFLLILVATSVLTAGRLWAGQAAAVPPPQIPQVPPTPQTPPAPRTPQTPSAPQTPSTSGAVPAAGSGTSAGQGVVLDRLVAVVNGDMILESDVDEERRFEEVQPYRAAADSTRARIIERLVDRALILQQAELQPEDAVTDKELDAQLATLRKDIPACKQYHCETEEGWKRFLGDHGFTEEEFNARWRQRMVLLKFIEVRFRNGVSVKDEEIQAYYEKTMLPEYAKRKVTPPPLETIKKRIEEVLLQQQVSALLQDWLKSLRAQGSVRIMIPGEVAP
jgi:peptidyl-prolyl cis-trans isomerase SurA